MTLFSVITFAQSKISGNVYNENSLPVNFANIVLMSADSSFVSGTITDENGKFSIEKNPKVKFLTVSCIGYETKFLSIDENQNTILVTLTKKY